MSFHLIQAASIMIILPIVSIVIEYFRKKEIPLWLIVAKWILFWSVGIRSLTAGIVQMVHPAYTAEIIFDLSGTDYYIFIRELGVANFAIGLSAIISMKKITWRIPVAFISFIFNLFLSVNHILNFQAGFNEGVSLAGDLLVVAALGYFLIRSYRESRAR